MGKYSVPKEIRDLKPKEKMVKAVNGQYFVYNYKNSKDENGKWKIKMGGNYWKNNFRKWFYSKWINGK